MVYLEWRVAKQAYNAIFYGTSAFLWKNVMRDDKFS